MTPTIRQALRQPLPLAGGAGSATQFGGTPPGAAPPGANPAGGGAPQAPDGGGPCGAGACGAGGAGAGGTGAEPGPAPQPGAAPAGRGGCRGRGLGGRRGDRLRRGRRWCRRLRRHRRGRLPPARCRVGRRRCRYGLGGRGIGWLAPARDGAWLRRLARHGRSPRWCLEWVTSRIVLVRGARLNAVSAAWRVAAAVGTSRANVRVDRRRPRVDTRRPHSTREHRCIERPSSTPRGSS